MGKIADHAVAPITQKSYPKTYAAWGVAGIARINALLQPAAEIVATSPGCDELVILELSGQRSSPPDKIVFYADCANGNRFYITEAEVLAGQKTISLNEKAKWLDDQQLVEISQGEVTSRLGCECSFFEASVYRAMAGRTVVSLGFSMMNDAGFRIVNAAECYFDGISLNTVEFRL